MNVLSVLVLSLVFTTSLVRWVIAVAVAADTDADASNVVVDLIRVHETQPGWDDCLIVSAGLPTSLAANLASNHTNNCTLKAMGHPSFEE